MAKTDDVIRLAKTHFDGDDDGFLAALRSIAANEAAAGRRIASDRIHAAINRRPAVKKLRLMQGEAIMEGLLFGRKSPLRISDMVLDAPLMAALQRILQEQQNRAKLEAHDLDAARKVLLFGASGVGKTMTAGVIAGELDIPFYSVSSHKIINSYLGETAKNLQKIFEFIPRTRGVYFFDEFDSLARERGAAHDVGEMSRVMGSLLQFIERDTSDSIIIAATNMPQILDKALYRRFDAVLEFQRPTPEIALDLMYKVLGKQFMDTSDVCLFTATAAGLSHAEIELACKNALKGAVLSDTPLTEQDIVRELAERQKAAAARKSKEETE